MLIGKISRVCSLFLLACILLSGCQKPATYVQDATVILEQGDPLEARALFEKAISVGTQKAEAYRGLAICYYEEEDYLKARGAFSKALHEGTKETGSFYHLWGTCEMKVGEMKASIDLFEKGLALGDASPEAAKEMEFNIISAYESLKDYDTVRAKLADYIAKYPDDEVAKKEADFFATQ